MNHIFEYTHTHTKVLYFIFFYCQRQPQQ